MPNTVPSGIYNLVITNLDAQTATLSTAFMVKDWSSYLPIIVKETA